MSVNSFGAILDLCPNLILLGCQGHLIEILDSLKPHKQTTQGQNAPTMIKGKR